MHGGTNPDFATTSYRYGYQSLVTPASEAARLEASVLSGEILPDAAARALIRAFRGA